MGMEMVEGLEGWMLAASIILMGWCFWIVMNRERETRPVW